MKCPICNTTLTKDWLGNQFCGNTKCDLYGKMIKARAGRIKRISNA